MICAYVVSSLCVCACACWLEEKSSKRGISENRTNECFVEHKEDLFEGAPERIDNRTDDTKTMVEFLSVSRTIMFKGQAFIESDDKKYGCVVETNWSITNVK